MVTIRDVARESGVSPTTVSHVLNGTRKVEPETAERVRQTIKRLHYQPLKKYAHFGLGDLKTAGFLACGAGANACSELLERLYPRLEAENIRPMLIMVAESVSDRELRALQKFYRLQYCVVHPSVRVTEIGKSAPAYPIPTIFISGTTAGIGRAQIIAYDYRLAIRLALSHLINRGHQEIAILSGMHNSEINDEINRAARAFFRERELDYQEESFLQIEKDFASQQFRAVTPINPDRFSSMTALITVGNRAAEFITEYFARQEIKCPQDLSVITMGGLYAMEISQPEMTRVDLGVPRLADALARVLLGERKDSEKTVLVPTFIPGASTRSLARNPSGLKASSPEILELSQEELARVRKNQFTVCVSLEDGNSMFSKLVLQGLGETLSGLRMILLETAVSNGVNTARDRQLREFSRLNPDVIISFSNNQTALCDRFIALSSTRAKLVLGVDVPQGLPEYAYSTCIATNEMEKGRLAARLLAAEMCRRGKHRIGFFCNGDVNFCACQRDHSAINTIAEDFPQLEVVFRRDFIREQNMRTTIIDALAAHPETEGLYIYSANAALLVQNYLLSVGRTDILIVTTQINDEIARMFPQHPNLIGIISSKAYEMGRLLGLAAAGSLIAKPLPHYIAVEPVAITEKNLEKSWVQTAKQKAPAN